MTFSAVELKAINRFCLERNLKPGLSVYPLQINFLSKLDSVASTTDMKTIMDVYNSWNTEDKKQRAKKRKLDREFEARSGKSGHSQSSPSHPTAQSGI